MNSPAGLLIMSPWSIQQQGVLGEACVVLEDLIQPPKKGLFTANQDGPSLERAATSERV